MFQMCNGLKSLNVSNFNTSKVTNMGYMFNVCSKLSNLNLRSFDTSKVTNIRCMFQSCAALKSLDLSKFNTQNVTITDSIFGNCQNLKTIYVSDNWTMDRVNSSRNMFLLCNSLVGGKGTTYNASYVDKTYARIDNAPTAPGYFTYKDPALLGDVNGDGEITAQDASLVLQLVAKKIDSTAEGVKYDAADVNGDGDVTAQDASLILQYVAKKITW